MTPDCPAMTNVGANNSLMKVGRQTHLQMSSRPKYKQSVRVPVLLRHVILTLKWWLDFPWPNGKRIWSAEQAKRGCVMS